jgi:hypothetical protein
MFFRFDPGFRSELEEARRAWRGSTDPLAVDDLSDESQFDLRAALHNDQRLRTTGLRLATRWGLDLTKTMEALAFDVPPNYPTASVAPRTTDPETGYHYTEIRIYSAYVWRPIHSALREIEWLDQIPNPRWFWDWPEDSPRRLSGLSATVTARTLALYFLMQARKGSRITGGVRTWEGAAALWRSLANQPYAPLGSDDRGRWRRDRRRLLRSLFRLSADPTRTLSVSQVERGLGDSKWAALLGIDGEAWHRIKCERVVSRAVWEQIKLSVPEIADRVDAFIELGLLKISTD